MGTEHKVLYEGETPMKNAKLVIYKYIVPWSIVSSNIINLRSNKL